MTQSLTDRPVVIQVQGVEKTFRIPRHRVDSLKERATHPFARQEVRELQALRDVSFNVHQGEFFGIVGRNGSGKSTLLKILASIYGADAGRIRMAGRVAPFIELGVGFNPELTARENVVLNGVMMGLSRREAAQRLDAVLDFAELRDFTDLKLKNYSSGMMVRLAFAVMVQADADVMLIDEVLAVGDASFTQKCMDVFRARRDAGKTIVLVTHDMATVQGMCHRAMLIHESEMQYIGDPDETAIRYYRLNFEGDEAHGGPGAGGIPDVHTKLIAAQLTDADGRPVENVEQGRPIGIDAVFEARRDLVGPAFGVHVKTDDDALVFALLLDGESGTAPERVAAGERIRIRGTIDNPLLPGRYVVDGFVYRRRGEGGGALQKVRLLDFLVFGTQPGMGVVRVDADVAAVVEPKVTVG